MYGFIILLFTTYYSFSHVTMSLANVKSFHFLWHKMNYEAEMVRIRNMLDEVEVNSSEDEETVEGMSLHPTVKVRKIM